MQQMKIKDCKGRQKNLKWKSKKQKEQGGNFLEIKKVTTE